MKKFVFAAVCTVTLAGFVMADEFTALITKVDGKNITYYKTKAAEGGKKGKAEKVGDAIKGTAADKVTVAKGMFNKDDMKFTAGDAIEGGLTADIFKNASDDAPVNAVITIADSGPDKGKITQVLKAGGGGKGGKKKGG